MSKRNIESGWRKSGIYPLNVDEPLKTPFVKEQIAIRGDSTVQTPTKTAERVREESVELEERDTRTIIRNLQKQIRELEAKNTLLATQLEHKDEEIARLSAPKKRKKSR